MTLGVRARNIATVEVVRIAVARSRDEIYIVLRKWSGKYKGIICDAARPLRLASMIDGYIQAPISLTRTSLIHTRPRRSSMTFISMIWKQWNSKARMSTHIVTRKISGGPFFRKACSKKESAKHSNGTGAPPTERTSWPTSHGPRLLQLESYAVPGKFTANRPS